MNRRAEREARGRHGEWLAAWYLRCKGWRILAQRVKTPRGEIDLVARRGGTVAFIEVKWRARADDLALSLDQHRLRRVAGAVDAVAHRYAQGAQTLRIDAILLAPGRWPRHIANAWQP